MKCMLIGYAVFCFGYPTININCLMNNLVAEMTANLSHVNEVVDRCDTAKGCCSHHGGVDHCDRGSSSYMCKDGTLSPTCKCNVR